MKEWSERDDLFLRDNWGKISASKIGEYLDGRSKCSVVGRAHRLHLPKLIASPTARLPGRGGEFVAQDRAASVLPALASLRAIAEEPFKREAIMPVVRRPSSPPADKPAIRKDSECCWPIGEPGTRDFRFCCEPAERGQPYCPECRKLAYAPRSRSVEVG